MNGSQSTLLIVDDEPSCREAFRMALEDEYRLIDTPSGKDALNILESGRNINLMLLDYFLPPGINGLEVIDMMNKMKCNIPVILVTGKGSEAVAVEAFRLGVKDYITKPFKVKELRKTIRCTIGSIFGNKSIVDQAIAFMEEHYSQPISARDVAEAMNLSYDHLAHLFKSKTGSSIQHWMNGLRIDKAKVLLKRSGLEMKEITCKTGFKNQNYFCRLFKKRTGISPQNYRKNPKQE